MTTQPHHTQVGLRLLAICGLAIILLISSCSAGESVTQDKQSSVTSHASQSTTTVLDESGLGLPGFSCCENDGDSRVLVNVQGQKITLRKLLSDASGFDPTADFQTVDRVTVASNGSALYGQDTAGSDAVAFMCEDQTWWKISTSASNRNIDLADLAGSFAAANSCGTPSINNLVLGI